VATLGFDLEGFLSVGSEDGRVRGQAPHGLVDELGDGFGIFPIVVTPKMSIERKRAN
jgi:hypothetical protein